MEPRQGVTLERRLRDPGLTVRESVTVARALAVAVERLHEQGLVHGDLSTRAVILEGGRVHLRAPGIAGSREGDVFALGALLHECLSGRRHDAERRPFPPEVPAPLAALVERMLARDPAQRPPSPVVAAELAALDDLDDEVRHPAPAEGRTLSLPNTGDAWPAAGDGGDELVSFPRSYRLAGEIARGGMGRVVSARDERLQRTVAVKQLLPPRSASRFVREAIITAGLEHPGIVPVYDSGISDDGLPFYTMKLVSGRSLADAIAGAGSTAERLALLPHAIAVTEAIAYAHSRGVIHRDLKPSNVVIGEFGETLVVDWGLAKVLAHDDDDDADATPEPGGGDGDETARGQAIGTPGYMAPEQAEGGRADERSDVYSLGALLDKLLSGGGPGGSLAGLPPDLVAIVDKALAADPAARYPNAGQLAADLRRFTTGQLVSAYRYGAWDLVGRWVRRRRAVVVSAALALLVILAGGIVSIRRIVQAGAVNERLLRDAYYEQGRLRVLEGDKVEAFTPLATAYRMGSTGLATRMLLEEAARATRPRLLTLTGHADKLWSIAYSPDDRWLATASSDRTARVWDAETGALRATLRHGDRVVAVAFSPDSRYLASGSPDGKVRVLDLIEDREVAVLDIDVFGNGLIFSPDGATLLAVSNPAVVLYAMPGGTRLGELPGRWLLGARFCKDGSCIVTWDEAGVGLWDPVTRARRASVAEAGVYCAAVARGGSLLALGTAAGELLLAGGDGTVIARRRAHDGFVREVVFSPDESLVATAAADHTVRLWSAAGDPRGLLTGHRATVTTVQFTPAGDRLVTTSADGTARLWSASGAFLGELAGHTNVILGAALRSDGRRLATASWDHTAVVWDLTRAAELRPIVSARDAPRPRVAFDPGGRRLAVGRADGSLTVFDVASGATVCAAAGAPAIERLVWNADEAIDVVRAGARDVEIRAPRSCALEARLEHPAPIAAISAQPGARLATAAGNVVRVYRNGAPEATFAGYPAAVTSVGVDGDQVYATLERPATVVVDTLAGGAPRRLFGGASKPITEVRLDRARGRVIAASLDQFLYVWDAATGALVGRLEGSGPLFGVATSSDGSYMIGVGGTAPTIWDRTSLARTGELDTRLDIVQGGRLINDLVFVSIANNGEVAVVWDVALRRPLFAFPDVEELAVSSDGRAVAFAGASGVRLWSPQPP